MWIPLWLLVLLIIPAGFGVIVFAACVVFPDFRPPIIVNGKAVNPKTLESRGEWLT